MGGKMPSFQIAVPYLDASDNALRSRKISVASNANAQKVVRAGKEQAIFVSPWCPFQEVHPAAAQVSKSKTCPNSSTSLARKLKTVNSQSDISEWYASAPHSTLDSHWLLAFSGEICSSHRRLRLVQLSEMRVLQRRHGAEDPSRVLEVLLLKNVAR